MAAQIQYTKEEAERARDEAHDAAKKYNAEHDDKRMVVIPLGNGNVQIVVEKVEEGKRP